VNSWGVISVRIPSADELTLAYKVRSSTKSGHIVDVEGLPLLTDTVEKPLVIIGEP
jgi:hypothetical protein